MTGFGNTRTRKHPRSRGRTRSRNGTDRVTIGTVGLVFAVAGLFALSIVLGPLAIVLGWLGMGRRWNTAHVPAVIAFTLGVVDTVLALMWLL
ncbi:small hydrophobic protein [Streptomyces niveus]|nr:small hydrophobic protein [Streptomyces niveus]